jgi:protein TonB
VRVSVVQEEFREGGTGMPFSMFEPAGDPGESLRARLVRFAIVVAAHAGLLGVVLTLQPRLAEDLGLTRMDVRTIVEAPKPEPRTPEVVPPKPLPQAARPRAAPPPAAPVMTASADAANAPSAFQVAPQPPAPPPAPVATAPAPAAPVAAAPLPVTAARFDADYLQNPPPVYPALSRRLREEGRVLLLVRVNAQGHAEGVQVRQSSGFERLDEAAQAAVRQWRFVPARRGDEAVAAAVVVPIVFRVE